MFRKSSFFSYLALALVFLAIHSCLRSMPNRADLPIAKAEVRYVPIAVDPAGFGPLRFAGAWQVEVADPRFGGVSALALDGGRLVALTDSGTVILLPKPGHDGRALVRDLPAGPGTPGFKYNRDAEALTRDASGGWWVAFENWNQLWLYDGSFTRSLARIDLGHQRWRENHGVEAMIADGRRLSLFAEDGDQWLEVEGSRLRKHRLSSPFGSISDATRASDGRLLLISRKMALGGLEKRLLEARSTEGRFSLRPLAQLGLDATANVEGIAAEPNMPHGTRLWLITDNDFRPRKATVLLALDLP